MIVRSMVKSFSNLEPQKTAEISSVSSSQETKYWFFKMQNKLLKLVNMVASSVSANAVLLAIKEAGSILKSEEHDEEVARK